MKYCIKCGGQLEDGDDFCAYCGAVQKESVTASLRNDNSPCLQKKKRMLLFIIAGIALLLIIAIVLILVLNASGSSEKRYNEQLSLAERYLDELDYDKAIAAYRAAIEIDSSRSDAYVGLAEIYISEKEYEKAHVILEEGIAATEGSDKRRLERKLKELEELMDGATVAEPTAVPTEAEKTDPHILYEAFMRNEIAADPDRCELNYTQYGVIDEPWVSIIAQPEVYLDDLSRYVETRSNTLYFEEAVSSYIDCGLDGNEELLIRIRYDFSNNTFAAEYGCQGCLTVLIREEEGQLYIRYACDTYEREYCNISYSGYIERYIHPSGSETMSYGYLDKDIQYHFWYSETQPIFFDRFMDFYNTRGEQVFLDLSGYDNSKLTLFDVYLGEDSPGSNVYLAEFIQISPGEYEYSYVVSDPEFRKTFENADIRVYTKDEIDGLIEQKKKKIGLSDEIRDYKE